jgi:Txe/YoeB family toxin of Txe-Axe toxin-antitoxin module
MNPPQIVLQVPLKISGNKVTVVGTPTTGPPASTRKALAQSKNRLRDLKAKIRIAQLTYKKNPTSNNLKIIDALRAQIAAISKTVKAQAKGAAKEYKTTLKRIRARIAATRRKLNSVSVKLRGPIRKKLDNLVNRYWTMQINHVTSLLNKNKSNTAAMRRVRTKLKDSLKAHMARMKRQTVANPKLNVMKSALQRKLKKVNVDLKKSATRRVKLVKWLNRVKARKNVYNSKRMMTKAAKGAMGAIPGALGQLNRTLRRHERILKILLRRRGIKTRRGKKKCPNLSLARRRLKAAIRSHSRLKKDAVKNPKLKKRVLASRRRINRLRRIVRRAIKCKGMVLCGNLKKARRNLKKARRAFMKAVKITKNRPSDEKAQRDKAKYRARVKVHRQKIRSIWACICRRAHKLYKKYKKLNAKRPSPGYVRRMKLHKRMIKRCNCRKARINFNRARAHYIKARVQIRQNSTNKKAKDQVVFFRRKMALHREKMKKYGCKLPPMPAGGGKLTIKKGGRRR